MNTDLTERRLFDRRLDDRNRPDGGAYVLALCLISAAFAVAGFVAGAWFQHWFK